MIIKTPREIKMCMAQFEKLLLQASRVPLPIAEILLVLGEGKQLENSNLHWEKPRRQEKKKTHQKNQPAPTNLNLRNTEELGAAIETTYLHWSYFINNLPNSGVCFAIHCPRGASLGLVSAVACSQLDFLLKSVWPTSQQGPRRAVLRKRDCLRCERHVWIT